MRHKYHYQDREQVNSAYDSILRIIQPGDVITQVGVHQWWQLWLWITHAAIQLYQRRVLTPRCNWKDTHAMLFLDADNSFSIEMPRATMKPLREYCLSHFSIYRLRLITINPEYMMTLRKAVQNMLGETYDFGQAIDMFIHQILQFDESRPLRLFDLGRRKKICSVGVRVAFEYLYKKHIRINSPEPNKWLFRTLNPEKWSPERIRKYSGTDIEATAPAHFANSDLFDNEFQFIARFKDGKQILPTREQTDTSSRIKRDLRGSHTVWKLR